ncbi:YwqG family protein [Corynebacterium sp. H130]|uniref:YwqG family protein n=1 Tax=Corynebacterium sp. H130 TaxID=3133444 RepID=UPI0030A68333
MDYLQIADEIGLPSIPRVSYSANSSEFRLAGLTDSKLGGAPYRPKGAGWPSDSNGQPLCFVAQLNLEQVEKDRVSAGVPPLLDGFLPTYGLLQYFLVFDEGFGIESQPNCYVYHLPDLSYAPDEPLFSYQPEVRGPIHWANESRTPEFEEASQFHSEDCVLKHPEVPFALESQAWQPGCQYPITGWHVEATAEHDRTWKERVPYPGNRHRELLGKVLHQVGGVANFTKEDPRPEGSAMRLLFQLDGDDDLVKLSDSGTMQFFIDPADLARKDFSNVQMHWNCYY